MRIKIWMVVAVVLLIGACLFTKRFYKTQRLREDFVIQNIGHHLTQLTSSEAFSGVVLIAKNGIPIFSQAIGLADREKQIPNSLDTKFYVASLGKMFTAVAIVGLVQQGKLKLSDAVKDFLPDYKNAGVAAVTIEQLLTHQGGTAFDAFDSPEYKSNIDHLRELSDYIAFYGPRGLTSVPGHTFEYSNYGYILLGAIIEQVAKQSYHDYIVQHIFKKAGMADSGFFLKDEGGSHKAIGYLNADPHDMHNNYDALPYRGRPDGGCYCTVADLLKFANALESHVLLDEYHTHLVTSGKVLMGTSPAKYGYGFVELEMHGMRCFGHDGKIPGANAEFIVCPNRYTIIVLSNVSNGAKAVRRFIVEQLLGALK